MRSRLVQVALAAGAVAILVFTVRGLREKPRKAPPPTVAVTRGIVLATVSATGNVTAERQLALDFPTSGKLVDLLVEEGERVGRGQPLARIDPGPARNQLAQAEAELASARSELARITERLTPEELAEAQAQVQEGEKGVDKAAVDLAAAEETQTQDEASALAEVDQARKALATVRSVADRRAADLQANVDQATGRLAHDRAQLDDEEARLAADLARLDELLRLEDVLRARRDYLRELERRIEQRMREKGCTTAGGTSPSSTTSTTTPTGTTPVSASAKTSSKTTSSTAKTGSSTTTTTAPTTTTTAPTTTTTAPTTTTTAPTTTTTDDPDDDAKDNTKECNRLADELSKVQNELARVIEDLRVIQSDRARAEADVRTDERRIDDIRRQVVVDTEELSDARHALTTARVEDRKKVEEATDALSDSLSGLESTRLEVSQAVTAARAEVASARAALGTKVAEKAVKEQAPSPGEVAAQQGVVEGALAKVREAERVLGETTLYSPAEGTVGVISAKVGEQVTGAGDTVARSVTQVAGGTPGTEPPGTVSGGSGGFITLTDVSTLQIEARFSEADAARIRPGQVATITFDALGSREVAANVVSVDSLETVENNVVTYNVTLLLVRAEEGIKPGMTASVDVVVAERKGVLRLPTSAVSPREGEATVTVLLPDGKTGTRTVRTGLKGDDDIEIISGLREGDQVVLQPGPAGGPPAPPQGGGGQR